MKGDRCRFFIVILMLVIITGCQKDILKPETNLDIVPVHKVIASSSESVPVTNIPAKKDPFFVQSRVKGNDLYIECIVTGISFRENDQSKASLGKIIVTVDGDKKEEVSTAAFIVKGLKSGNHRIHLEIMKLNNQPYKLSKEFTITIP